MEPNEPFPSEDTSSQDSDEAVVQLTFEETRVLGSLIEKELTTPEYYHELKWVGKCM